jgi:type IV secretion system protein VirD4
MDVLRLFFVLLLTVLRGFGLTLLGLAKGFGWLFSAIIRALRRDYRDRGVFGTARWASGWEKWRAGVYGGAGPIIGQTALGRLVRFNRDGIVHVFASPGSGKGVGIVVPTLLTYPGSMVVTDVKGENYAVTARYRSKLGRVLMLNPSDLARSARFNPMDTIRVGTDQESDDAAALAALMVIKDSAEGHWADKSTALLTAFILHALHDPDPVKRTLAHVCKLSVGGQEVIVQRVTDIAENSPSALAQTVAQGFQGTMGDDKGFKSEFASVLSDLQKATKPWAEGTPTGFLSASSTFALEDLNAPEVTTLYLCLDEEKLFTYRRWLRVVTGCTLNAIMRQKRTQRPRHKVMLLLDEARALGRLDPFVDAVAFLRTYCTPVLIWQNVAQVHAAYGDQGAEFLANATCRVFFGIEDQPTAQLVAEMCGQKSVQSRSQGVSQQSDAWLRENRSQNESESGYYLIDPAEVQRLPSTTVVAKMRHVPYPMRLKRVTYHARLAWLFRYDRWAPDASAPVPVQTPSLPPVPPRAPSRGPSLAPDVAPGATPPPGVPSTAPPPDAARW